MVELADVLPLGSPGDVPQCFLDAFERRVAAESFSLRRGTIRRRGLQRLRRFARRAVVVTGKEATMEGSPRVVRDEPMPERT